MSSPPLSSSAVPVASAYNSVLLVGDSSVGKHWLAQRISCDSSSPSSSSTLPTPVYECEQTGIQQYHMKLETKYYEADVRIHLLPAALATTLSLVQAESDDDDDDEEEETSSAASASPSSSSLPSSVQALLLVFDLGRPSTFHSLASRWSKWHARKQPSVAMIVGNEVRAEEKNEEKRKEQQELELLVKDWAVEQQIEYVRLPFNDTLHGATPLASSSSSSSSAAAAAASSSSSSSDDELDPSAEPLGLSRIVESLQCNAWELLRMKDRKTLQFAAAERRKIEEEEEEEQQEEEEERRNEEAEAAIFASMQETAGVPHVSAEDSFQEFVSAATTTISAAATSTSSSSSSTSSSTSTAATAAAVSTTSASVTSSSSASSKPTPAVVRSASASAFANAFANAIRVPDTATNNKNNNAAAATTKKTNKESTAATPTPQPSSAAASTTASTDAIDAPISPEEMDALAQQLAAASSSSSAAAASSSADDTSDVPSDVLSDESSFDALFEKITSFKTQLHQSRAAGKELSDAERRAKAEEQVKMMLKSMGMEDEWGEDDDEEEEEKSKEQTEKKQTN